MRTKKSVKSHKVAPQVRGAAAAPAAPPEVKSWFDDPLSGLGRRSDPAPDLNAASLRIAIAGPAVPAADYPLGTSKFRYWNAASILARGAAYWSRLLPGARWNMGNTLPVILDGGVDLNAYYDRSSLSFFHSEVAGRTVYSGESADVVLHEMGHAILDILRPELWDEMSTEAAAFHESVGDMVAILVHLDDLRLCTAVLDETTGVANRSSRISRVAEELGWAIRQGRPSDVAPDCLRNAANSFAYANPSGLPPAGPDNVLTRAPHSFSRVFTGAFLDALASMHSVAQGATPADRLHQAAADSAKILVTAIPATPVVARFFSQVAAHMIEADGALFAGRYTAALRGAFVRRGILSLGTVTSGAKAVRGVAAAGVAASRQVSEMDGARLGLPGERIALSVATAGRRFAVTSSDGSAAHDSATAPQADAEEFAKFLVRRGRVVADGDLAVALPVSTGVHKTHRLDRTEDGRLAVRRLRFDCGFD